MSQLNRHWQLKWSWNIKTAITISISNYYNLPRLEHSWKRAALLRCGNTRLTYYVGKTHSVNFKALKWYITYPRRRRWSAPLRCATVVGWYATSRNLNTKIIALLKGIHKVTHFKIYRKISTNLRTISSIRGLNNHFFFQWVELMWKSVRNKLSTNPVQYILGRKQRRNHKPKCCLQPMVDYCCKCMPLKFENVKICNSFN